MYSKKNKVVNWIVLMIKQARKQGCREAIQTYRLRMNIF